MNYLRKLFFFFLACLCAVLQAVQAQLDWIQVIQAQLARIQAVQAKKNKWIPTAVGNLNETEDTKTRIGLGVRDWFGDYWSSHFLNSGTRSLLT